MDEQASQNGHAGQNGHSAQAARPGQNGPAQPENGLHRWNGVPVPEGLLSMVVPEAAVKNREQALDPEQVVQGMMAFARRLQGISTEPEFVPGAVATRAAS